MKGALYLLLLAASLTGASGYAAAPAGKEIPLAPQTVEGNHAAITAIGAEKKRLRIEFQTAEWPNMYVAAPSPWDWRKSGGLALHLSNPGAEAVSFAVRIDDDRSADGVRHCRTGSGVLDGGKSAAFVFSFSADPMVSGMRELPPAAPGMRPLKSSSSPLDLAHIVAFQIFLHAPPAPQTLILDRAELLPAASLVGIVDRFGQYTGTDWPGKLKDEAELASRRRAEEAELKANASLPDRDEYSGWTKGPQMPASGWFKTAKVSGRWWLVTPSGHLFFSTGVDHVASGFETVTTGRDQMFAWLPKPGEPLADHLRETDSILYGPVKKGAAFDFYGANLERKYGHDYEKPWAETALARLKAWGFNTVAMWSEEQLGAMRRVPYVASGGVYGKYARISSGEDYWGKMADPWDPEFERAVSGSLRGLIARVKDDPWCLGYFVDNELSWAAEGAKGRYGLACGALAVQASESPAKRAFLAALKTKHRTIAALNSAWGTSLPDWTALEAEFKAPSTPTEAMKADLSAFLLAHARKYFGIIAGELRRQDPHHLYLGCRFAWRSPEAVQAAAEACDVVSFNVYKPRLEPAEWDFTKALDRPCLVGEFHFGALDRGMFSPGLVDAGSQAGRGRMYQEYVRSVLDHPAFVGCHWFEWADEPVVGRAWDGENYNIGMVDVTDAPYPELTAAAREVHRTMYERRAGTR